MSFKSIRLRTPSMLPNTSGNRLSVIDGKTNAVVKTFEIPSPTGVAIDPGIAPFMLQT